MSFSPATPVLYKRGFKNPSGDKSAEMRASFRRETIPAKVGVAAEVPPMEMGEPERKMRKKSPWAATSGMAY